METLIAHHKKETFSLLADAMPQIVWTAQPDGTLNYINNRWYDYTGFDKGNESADWLSVMHPDDLSATLTIWHESLQTGQPYEIEYRFSTRITPDKYRWFLARALPVKDKQGNILMWIGTCTDIDDMKQSQQAVVEKEKMLMMAYEGAKVGIWDWDIVSNQLKWHGRLKELYGLPNDAAVTTIEEFLQTVLPEDVTRVHDAAMSAITNGTPYDVEFRVRWQDGSVHWLSGKGGIQRNAHGTPLSLSGINIDITERKNAELALEHSTFELQTLTDHLPDIVVRFDRRLRYQFANTVLAKMFGTTPVALLGKNYRELGMTESLCIMFDEQLNDVFANGLVAVHEYELPGTSLWYHSVLVPEFNLDKSVESVLVVTRDITNHKLAQIRLIQSREQLKLISDTAPAYIIHCDSNKRFKFVNKAYADRFKIQPEDCIGKTIAEVIGEKAYATLSHYIELALSGERCEFEGIVPYEKLGKLYMHSKHAPEFDANGNVIGFVAVVTNITDRKQAELELKDMEQRLESMIDTRKTESEETNKETQQNTITLNNTRGFRNINKKDITHLEAVQGYAVIYLVNGEKIMSSKNLADYEKMLNDPTFYRVHRSYLINLSHFSELKTTDGPVAILSNKTEIPVSRRLLKTFSDMVKRV